MTTATSSADALAERLFGATLGALELFSVGVADDGRFGLDADNIRQDVEIVTGTRFADEITATGTRTVIGQVIEGGQGDDVLRAGTSGQRIAFSMSPVADGADKIIGGPVRSSVAYGERTRPVNVTLNFGGADDGEAGERDEITGGHESVEGGQAGDTLRAPPLSRASHSISGRAGNDTIDGAEGDDTLNGGPRGDAIRGLGGADRVFAKDGEVDNVDCGLQNDTAEVDSPNGPAPRPRQTNPTTEGEPNMTITPDTTPAGKAGPAAFPRSVSANDLEIYVDQVGQGPDVLLIGGLGDTVESWQFQLDGLADRYRLTAFDNRGAGRTAMPEGPATVEAMADDAAGVLRSLDIASAHVAGFSGGSIIAQELALRHPELVRSLVLQSTWPVMDPYLRKWAQFVRWLVDAAPSERAFLEWFFMFIYTPRANNDETVDQIIDEVLAFPHKQAPEDTQRTLDAFLDHDTSDRLAQITAPTLVLAGALDMTSRPELCRAVAELIPDARYELMEEESHQPFQEVPDEWNARVDAFWRQVEAV